MVGGRVCGTANMHFLCVTSEVNGSIHLITFDLFNFGPEYYVIIQLSRQHERVTSILGSC